MSQSPHSDSECNHENLNELVTVTVMRPTTDALLKDCSMCQTEEGRKAIGVFTRQIIPLDMRLVLVAEVPPVDGETDTVPEQEYDLCVDCIRDAQRQGVNVLDTDGNKWEPSGFFLRQ